jgi:hypothetical protein
MNSVWYPKNLFIGQAVEHAMDPKAPDGRWYLGHVAVLKNDSCDINVVGEGGIVRQQHDCYFVDDPRCKTNTQWAEQGRGVFRLSKKDERIEKAVADAADCRTAIAGLAARLDAVESELAARRAAHPAAPIAEKRGPGKPRTAEAGADRLLEKVATAE